MQRPWTAIEPEAATVFQGSALIDSKPDQRVGTFGGCSQQGSNDVTKRRERPLDPRSVGPTRVHGVYENSIGRQSVRPQNLPRHLILGRTMRAMRQYVVGIVVALAVVGCDGAKKPAVDAAGNQITCEASFQTALDRTCSVAADCGLVSHDDCCGTVRLGVRAGTEAAATLAEATYRACFSCGARGCDHAELAEDGNVANAGRSIVATCTMGRCKSIVQ